MYLTIVKKFFNFRFWLLIQKITTFVIVKRDESLSNTMCGWTVLSWDNHWDFITRKQVQQINSRHSTVKLSKIGFSATWNSFSNIASLAKRRSLKLVFPWNKSDGSWEINSKKTINDSHLFQSNICSARTTLLNKGPETSSSLRLSASELAKKTILIYSLMLCRKNLHYLVKAKNPWYSLYDSSKHLQLKKKKHESYVAGKTQRSLSIYDFWNMLVIYQPFHFFWSRCHLFNNFETSKSKL